LDVQEVDIYNKGWKVGYISLPIFKGVTLLCSI